MEAPVFRLLVEKHGVEESASQRDSSLARQSESNARTIVMRSSSHVLGIGRKRRSAI